MLIYGFHLRHTPGQRVVGQFVVAASLRALEVFGNIKIAGPAPAGPPLQKGSAVEDRRSETGATGERMKPKVVWVRPYSFTPQNRIWGRVSDWRKSSPDAKEMMNPMRQEN